MISIKKFILKLCVMLLLAGLFLMPSVPAQAAVKKIGILNSDGRKSCRVDLDGDGVKERLSIKLKQDEYGTFHDAALYVNGKKAATLKKPLLGLQFGADYVKMSDDHIFIRCYVTSDNDSTVFDCFYRYDPDSGRLIKAAELLDVNESGSYAAIKSVSASKLMIQYEHWVESIGYISWTSTYTVKDGKLKRDTKASDAKSGFSTKSYNPDDYGKLFEKNQYKAMVDLIFHTDLSMQKEAFRIKKNDILTLKKVKYTKDHWYLLFEKDGKQGWIDIKSIGGMEIFYGVNSRHIFP